ncbi:MAG TPA: hypothetical protein VI524_13310 [Anaerolineales bacterium]|nr:hypothetical protein [Anaerolineales bacterium]
MSEQNYPDYIRKMLVRAEELLANEEEADPAEAAAIGFEVLALFPGHEEASRLIQHAFRDGQLIRDNRKALSRLIDEWDDRLWQQHRRLALSFGYMSRWEGWHPEYEEGHDDEREGPADVRKYLQEGHAQLLEDYLGGQVEGAEASWQIFQGAIRLSKDPRLTMLWVGKEYARQGYFAESVDVLNDLLAKFPNDQDARRLWAEVRWWRDHQDRIPWIPPAGDGSRFRRRMAEADPEGLAASESPENILNRYHPPDPENLPPDMKPLEHVPSELEKEMKSFLEAIRADPGDSPVDWSYLDAIERGKVDVSRFPKWAREFLEDIDDPEQREFTERMLLEQFSNKALYPDDEIDSQDERNLDEDDFADEEDE